MAGDASDAPLRDVRGVEVVLLWPVTHRTVQRLGFTLDGSAAPGDVAAPGALPSIDDVVAGWAAQLRRGMRVDLPDASLQTEVDTARADLLLAATSVARPDEQLLVSLEDWGFDPEAAAAWQRAGWRARQAARRRGRSRPAAESVLSNVRDALVREHGNEVEILPAPRAEWRGGSLDVRDAPTRAGRLSYSVRWHGERPALLWEVREPVTGLVLRAPGLDDVWSTSEAAGEVLLRGPR